MLGIDTNLLLYSLSPKSRFHEASRRFLKHAFREERVVISDLVLVELYLHLRNPVVMRSPLSPMEATSTVRSFLGFPSVTRAEAAPVMDKVWEWAAKPRFARRRIIDLRLALTLQHHGVTRFATANVKDFQGVGFEKVWDPTVAKRL
jgi:toxin-antitoxin system PIN domain toxin